MSIFLIVLRCKEKASQCQITAQALTTRKKCVFMMDFWFEKAICKFCKFVIFLSKTLYFKRVKEIVKRNHLDF